MNGMAALASALNERSKQVTQGLSIFPLEFGTIDDELNLIPDSLKEFKIPVTDYLVNRTFLLDEDYPMTDTLMITDPHTTVEGKHDHGGATGQAFGPDAHTHTISDVDSEHKHEVKVPAEFNKLKNNDRVMIAWVKNVPVILCVVVRWAAHP